MIEVLSRTGKIIEHGDHACYYNLDIERVNPDGTYLYKFGRLLDDKEKHHQESECVLIRIDNVKYLDEILSNPEKWWKYSYNKNKGMKCINVIYDRDEWASNGLNVPPFKPGFDILEPVDDRPSTKIDLNEELNSDIVISQFKSKEEARKAVKYYPLINILNDHGDQHEIFNSRNEIRRIYHIRLWIENHPITKEYCKEVIIPKLECIIRKYYEGMDKYLNDGLDI